MLIFRLLNYPTFVNSYETKVIVICSLEKQFVNITARLK